jgi:hypothetical protein
MPSLMWAGIIQSMEGPAKSKSQRANLFSFRAETSSFSCHRSSGLLVLGLLLHFFPPPPRSQDFGLELRITPSILLVPIPLELE